MEISKALAEFRDQIKRSETVIRLRQKMTKWQIYIDRWMLYLGYAVDKGLDACVQSILDVQTRKNNRT